MIEFYKTKPDADMPLQAHRGDAGYDLTCIEDFTVEPGKVTRVGTGIGVRQTGQTAVLIMDRSSNPISRGISMANGVGLIDSGYSGEISGLFMASTDEPVTIKKGTRVLQAVCISYLQAEGANVQNEHRGANGFGSSGE